jgi:hypothetical protein
MDTEMASSGLPITIRLLPGLGSARVFRRIEGVTLVRCGGHGLYRRQPQTSGKQDGQNSFGHT